MIYLPINKKIVKTFRDYYINSDYIGSALIVLLCLYHKNYTLLDEMDKENHDRLFLEVYKDLELKNLIEKTDCNETVHFTISDLGMELLTLILKEEKRERKKTPLEEIPENKLILETNWVDNWMKLWKDPRTNNFYKSIGNDGNIRSLRSTKKDIERRFINFFKNYSDIFQYQDPLVVVMQATINYLDEERKNNFAYTKNCMNFIMKVEGRTKDTRASTLAMWCEEFIEKSSIAVEQPIKNLNSYDGSIN